MGAFLDKEKFHQEQFLRQSGYFIETHPLNEIRPTRLPQALASQNLNPAIRADALDTFERDHIQWPRGSQALPSPDLCDISVNCVNFLYPFSTRPDALADLMGMIFPTLQTILPFENGAFINFFWPHDPQKSNADAAFIFQRHDSKRQMVLLHWNYCETYSPAVLNEGQNYAHLSAADLPLKNDQLEDINQLFYQPFLRLLELQLLAQQLEKCRSTTSIFWKSSHPACANLAFHQLRSGKIWCNPTIASPAPSQRICLVTLIFPATRRCSIGGFTLPAAIRGW